MAESDSGEKTEEPTPHKLSEARKKGQIAKSKDMTASIMLIVAFLMLKNSATHIWNELVGINYKVFGLIPVPLTPSVVGFILRDVVKTFMLIMAPMLAANFITAIVVESLQTGFLVSLESLMPKLEKINPIEGLKKYFSLKQYIEILKSLFKMAVVIILLYGVIKDNMGMVILSTQLSLWQIMGFTGDIVMKVVTRLGLFYFIIAIFDLFYQRHVFHKSMKMSLKEIKDEYKRLEGDPMIKQRQKDAARQMSQGRQMGSVPQADVVVTNPIHLAIAVAYKPGEMKAPKVLAKGKRLVAAEIRRIATDYQIPIVQNPPLARLLFKETQVGSEIPETYYKAMADILAFVYNLKKKRYSNKKRSSP